MKKNIIILILSVCMLSSCLNDSFMDRKPLDQLTSETVFTTNDNFKSYMWKYYNESYFLPMNNTDYQDIIFDVSDNAVNQEGVNSTPTWAWDKTIIPTSGGGWNFGVIRGLNLMLDNIDNSQLTDKQKVHWRSVGYFFKAMEYIRLMTKFGDLPWLEHYITENDVDVLYAARTPRKEIAQKIMEMLKYAQTNITTQNDGANTINLNCVNALISRFGLYEGTYEKYHELSSTAEYNTYLEESANSSKELMKVFPTLIENYDAVCNSKELAGKPGIILYKSYLGTRGYGSTYCRLTRAYAFFNHATADLVQSYLCTDGKPIWTSGVYQGDQITGNDKMNVEFKNRDRRLYYTIVPPYKIYKRNANGKPIPPSGIFKEAEMAYSDNPEDNYFIDMMNSICKEDGSTKTLPLYIQGVDKKLIPMSPHFTERYKLGVNPAQSRGGYYIYKFYETFSNTNLGDGEADMPIFRMGEVLLNYAETMYELGNFTQDIADVTINKLRNRAHVANMNISEINEAFDPKRDSDVAPVLWEIRRERRVELMAEGFRWNDICRWKKGEYLSKIPKGAYVEKTDLENKYFMTNPDVSKFLYALDGTDAGRIILYGTPQNPQNGIPNPGFLNKYYLSPLPIDNLLLNDKLEQNPGWEDTTNN